jgi:hypothetical protein
VPIDPGAVRRFDCQVPLGSCLPIRVIAATLPAMVLAAVYLANTAILQLWLTNPGLTSGPRTRIQNWQIWPLTPD